MARAPIMAAVRLIARLSALNWSPMRQLEAPIAFNIPISRTLCRTINITENRITTPATTKAAIIPIRLVLPAFTTESFIRSY